MFRCNYCGRYLKKEYDNCPNCGAMEFSPVSWFGEQVIREVPSGGYTINNDNLNKKRKVSKMLKWGGIGAFIISIISFVPFLLGGLLSIFTGDLGFGLTFIISSICMSFIPFLIVAFILLKFSKKNEKEIKELEEKLNKLAYSGTLIKGLPYELIDSGVVINGIPLKKIKIEYKNANGVSIPLISDIKYNRVLGSKDGTVDLLIDEEDFSNYYIDFEIY